MVNLGVPKIIGLILSVPSMIILAFAWKRDRVLETRSFYVSPRKFFSTLGIQGWFLAVYCMHSLRQAWPSYWSPVLHVSICTHSNVQSHHKPCSDVVVGCLVCQGYLFGPQEDPSSTCSDHTIGWSTEMIFRVSGHDRARRSCTSVFWDPLSLDNCLVKGGIPGRLWRASMDWLC